MNNARHSKEASWINKNVDKDQKPKINRKEIKYEEVKSDFLVI